MLQEAQLLLRKWLEVPKPLLVFTPGLSRVNSPRESRAACLSSLVIEINFSALSVGNLYSQDTNLLALASFK